MGGLSEATTGSYTGKVLVVNYQAVLEGTSGSVRVYASNDLVVPRVRKVRGEKETTFTTSRSAFAVFLTREPDVWSDALRDIPPRGRSAPYCLPAGWDRVSRALGVQSPVVVTSSPIRVSNTTFTVRGQTILVFDPLGVKAPLVEALKGVGVEPGDRSRLLKFMMRQITDGARTYGV